MYPYPLQNNLLFLHSVLVTFNGIAIRQVCLPKLENLGITLSCVFLISCQVLYFD